MRQHRPYLIAQVVRCLLCNACRLFFFRNRTGTTYDMSVALDTSQFEILPLNLALLNICDISSTLDTSHFETPLRDAAKQALNIPDITLGTSHFEMAPLKELTSANIWLLYVTRDTSHFDVPLRDSVERCRKQRPHCTKSTNNNTIQKKFEIQNSTPGVRNFKTKKFK